MQQAEALSLEQVRAFLEGSENVEFAAASRAARYALFEAVLRRHHYAELGRPEKGLVRRFLQKLSGLSRAQTTRLISQFRRQRTVRPTAYRRRRFPTRYTPADIVLLARVDEARRQLAGPATCAILRREFELYRQPDPRGRPGYVRVDTVHSPEQDGTKGAYTINLVDQVTQWQVLGCVERISEHYLAPLLQQLLAQFPFEIRGFHSDNGSEFINHTTAGLLEKLRIEFTKSRARRSNDNALVETKNGAVVRKWMGYQFLPSQATDAIHRFYCEWLNPYVNFHRPCAFASLRPDRHGKLRRVYRDWHTPYEALAALPAPQRGLREGVTLAALQAQASECSDTVFAERLQQRLRTLQRTCADLALPW